MKFLSHSKSVPRLSQVTQEQLDDLLTQGRGNCGTPFLVEDATKDWPCMEKWSFDWLKEVYGDIEVRTCDCLAGKVFMKGRFGDYIDYILEVKNTNEVPKNFQYVNPLNHEVIEAPLESPKGPQYLLTWNLETVYELTQDFHEPYFMKGRSLLEGRNLVERLKLSVQPNLFNRHNWIFVGPAGSISQMHNDHDHVHTYLAQVLGKKHYVLFSPSDAALVSEVRPDGIVIPTKSIDPLNPDIEKFPRFYEAEAYEVTIERGDLLFLPSHWLHFGLGIEPSITVSKDTVDYINYDKWFQSVTTSGAPVLAGARSGEGNPYLAR
ncbi:MAG TPA: cupin-like domain-containing protein [Kamptonema sp.]|nr:cupin-like domain-containing protein [Kamptonema sp.]